MPIGLENLNDVFVLKLLNKLQIISFRFEADLVGDISELFPREFQSLVIGALTCKFRMPIIFMKLGLWWEWDRTSLFGSTVTSRW